MLEAVLGRLDNISQWEALLDEWNFPADEEVPFPLSDERRKELHALAQEVALVRAHHVVRRYFKGDLGQLQDTLLSLSRLVRTVNEHELLAGLDEEQQMKQIEDLRKAAAKGERLARAQQALDDEMVQTYRDVEPSEKGLATPQDTPSEEERR
jgi:hypothetical protein